MKFLEKNKFELKHYRGQGYDNAANMTGKNSCVHDYCTSKYIGVLLRGRHNLNHVLSDAAKSPVESVLCLVS